MAMLWTWVNILVLLVPPCLGLPLDMLDNWDGDLENIPQEILEALNMTSVCPPGTTSLFVSAPAQPSNWAGMSPMHQMTGTVQECADYCGTNWCMGFEYHKNISKCLMIPPGPQYNFKPMHYSDVYVHMVVCDFYKVKDDSECNITKSPGMALTDMDSPPLMGTFQPVDFETCKAACIGYNGGSYQLAGPCVSFDYASETKTCKLRASHEGLHEDASYSHYSVMCEGVDVNVTEVDDPCVIAECGTGICDNYAPGKYTCRCEDTTFCPDCLNGGTPWEGLGRCACQPGWTGQHCQERGEISCENGGSLETNGYYYYCTCPSGWTGFSCEVPDTAPTPSTSTGKSGYDTCRDTELGTEYTGTMSVTAQGFTCHYWKDYYGTQSSEDQNYCRNPDNDANGPWCFARNPHVLFDYCDVPFCSHSSATTPEETTPVTSYEECRFTEKGTEYTGTISVTVEGYNCDNWSKWMLDDTFTDHNYCRNPDQDLKGPWCFVSDDPDKSYGYCDIPYCDGASPTPETTSTVEVTTTPSGSSYETCRDSELGTEYTGTMSTTAGGHTCKSWQEFSMLSPDDQNYCRNPDEDSGGPWCFTDDFDVLYDYCNIPFCSDVSTTTQTPTFTTPYLGYRFEVDGVIYAVLEDPVLGTEAEGKCQELGEGFQLSSVTAEEAAAITSHIDALNMPPNPEYWVGGGTFSCNIISKWELYDYDSPVFLTTYTKPCDECCRKVLCVKKSGDVSTTTQTPTFTTPYLGNRFEVDGVIYAVLEDPVLGTEAEGKCQELGEGFQLSSVTAEEAAAITSHIDALNMPPNPEYWVGGGTFSCNIISKWEEYDYDSPVFLTTYTKPCYECCRKVLCVKKSAPSTPSTGNTYNTCRDTEVGNEYTGTLSVTQKGYTCIDWPVDLYASQTLEANYCRNPDNDQDGPWCLVDEDDAFYDYCDIPFCSDGSTTPGGSGQCEPGWDSYNGHCYLFRINEDESWNEAQQSCHSLNGNAHLATVETVEEFDYLKQKIREEVEKVEYFAHELWWVGGKRDPTDENKFLWADGQDQEFSEETNSLWYPGEPNDTDDIEDHVNILHLHGVWGLNDSPEHNRLRSICEYNPSIAPTPATTPSPALGCPAHWLEHDGKCYRTHHDCARNWTEAMKDCQREGGHLASLENEEENDFVTSNLEALDVTEWWIGGFKNKSDGSWNWKTEKEGKSVPMSYTNWHFYEPNDSEGREDKLALSKDGLRWGWNDLVERQLNPYICEAPSQTVLTGCESNPCRNGGRCTCPSTEEGKEEEKEDGVDESVSINDIVDLLASLFDGLDLQDSGYQNNTKRSRQKRSFKSGMDYQCTCPPNFVGKQCEYGLDDDWLRHDNFEYRIVEDCGKPWEEAALTCGMFGGYLASFHSEEEMTFMTERLEERRHSRERSVYGYSWWIGGKAKPGTNGFQREWVWEEENGDVPMHYTNWRQGEPSNFNGQEEHIELIYDYWNSYDENYQWNDITGTKTLPFICKKKAN